MSRGVAQAQAWPSATAPRCTAAARRPCASAPVGGQCHFVDATVVKSIHAICVANDGHQFPASHMTPDTWINAGYEGEMARWLRCSTLRVLAGRLGDAVQTRAWRPPINRCRRLLVLRRRRSSQSLQGWHATLRPRRKEWWTAPSAPIFANTARGDMFFTYVTKVCLEQHQDLAERRPDQGKAPPRPPRAPKAMPAAQAQSRELHLTGMTFNGGVGGLGFY